MMDGGNAAMIAPQTTTEGTGDPDYVATAIARDLCGHYYASASSGWSHSR